jgi:uncharacterized protein YjbI with pentapeptide repeats
LGEAVITDKKLQGILDKQYQSNKININDGSLRGEQVKIIKESILEHTNITSLDLSGCNLLGRIIRQSVLFYDGIIKNLAQLIKGSKSLQYLNLSQTKLSTDGCLILSRYDESVLSGVIVKRWCMQKMIGDVSC